MEKEQITQLLEKQRQYFYSGATLNLDFRISALKRLRASIRKHEAQIHAALRKDLGKSNFESYMCETGLLLDEISHMIRNLPDYAEEIEAATHLSNFPGRSYTKPVPYGVVLIMSPWNYPVLLSLEPLVDALAAGNTAIIKTSTYAPASSEVVVRIIKECFDPSYVAVVTGGREENTALLSQKFDYIFFTGSPATGRDVMTKAAAFLTPVTLELGGKSPCIVDRKCNLKLAARRIVFGKFLNCGQTCVAPDYILCDKKIKDRLIKQIIKQIRRQYSEDPLSNPDYGKIINQKHFDRICALMDSSKIVHGGRTNEKKLQIEPTVMDSVTWEDAVMKEEILGPVLHFLKYETIDKAI